MIINEEYVLKTDLTELRDILFKEDEEGRYRERVMDAIRAIGTTKWFKARGLPTEEDSVWKNRYCGTETTLKKEIEGWGGNFKHSIEREGYFLWENYLPIDIWTDKDLHAEYKENPTLEKFGVEVDNTEDDDEYYEEEPEEKPKMASLTAWC